MRLDQSRGATWARTELRAGDILSGRFLVEAQAGSGGMGVVYRARDQASDEAVAVKVIDPEDPDNTSRFAQEGLLLARLSHPSIVRYVAHGTSAEGAPFIAMEWLEGEDDQARQAARCALLLQRAYPEMSFSVATGRAETTGRIPVGAAIDKAAELLTRTDAANDGIAIDSLTADLLDPIFELRREGSASRSSAALPSSRRHGN